MLTDPDILLYTEFCQIKGPIMIDSLPRFPCISGYSQAITQKILGALVLKTMSISFKQDGAGAKDIVSTLQLSYNDDNYLVSQYHLFELLPPSSAPDAAAKHASAGPKGQRKTSTSAVTADILDTRVITLISYNVFLPDLAARGYSRKYALYYITFSQPKITDIKFFVLNCFKEAINVLKYALCIAFRNDVRLFARTILKTIRYLRLLHDDPALLDSYRAKTLPVQDSNKKMRAFLQELLKFNPNFEYAHIPLLVESMQEQYATLLARFALIHTSDFPWIVSYFIYNSSVNFISDPDPSAPASDNESTSFEISDRVHLSGRDSHASVSQSTHRSSRRKNSDGKTHSGSAVQSTPGVQDPGALDEGQLLETVCSRLAGSPQPPKSSSTQIYYPLSRDELVGNIYRMFTEEDGIRAMFEITIDGTNSDIDEKSALLGGGLFGHETILDVLDSEFVFSQPHEIIIEKKKRLREVSNLANNTLFNLYVYFIHETYNYFRLPLIDLQVPVYKSYFNEIRNSATLGDIERFNAVRLSLFVLGDSFTVPVLNVQPRAARTPDAPSLVRPIDRRDDVRDVCDVCDAPPRGGNIAAVAAATADGVRRSLSNRNFLEYSADDYSLIEEPYSSGTECGDRGAADTALQYNELSKRTIEDIRSCVTRNLEILIPHISDIIRYCKGCAAAPPGDGSDALTGSDGAGGQGGQGALALAPPDTCQACGDKAPRDQRVYSLKILSDSAFKVFINLNNQFMNNIEYYDFRVIYNIPWLLNAHINQSVSQNIQTSFASQTYFGSLCYFVYKVLGPEMFASVCTNLLMGKSLIVFCNDLMLKAHLDFVLYQFCVSFCQVDNYKMISQTYINLHPSGKTGEDNGGNSPSTTPRQDGDVSAYHKQLSCAKRSRVHHFACYGDLYRHILEAFKAPYTTTKGEEYFTYSHIYFVEEFESPAGAPVQSVPIHQSSCVTAADSDVSSTSYARSLSPGLQRTEPNEDDVAPGTTGTVFHGLPLSLYDKCMKVADFFALAKTHTNISPPESTNTPEIHSQADCARIQLEQSTPRKKANIAMLSGSQRSKEPSASSHERKSSTLSDTAQQKANPLQSKKARKPASMQHSRLKYSVPASCSHKNSFATQPDFLNSDAPDCCILIIPSNIPNAQITLLNSGTASCSFVSRFATIFQSTVMSAIQVSRRYEDIAYNMIGDILYKRDYMKKLRENAELAEATCRLVQSTTPPTGRPGSSRPKKGEKTLSLAPGKPSMLTCLRHEEQNNYLIAQNIVHTYNARAQRPSILETANIHMEEIRLQDAVDELLGEHSNESYLSKFPPLVAVENCVVSHLESLEGVLNECGIDIMK